MIQICGKNHYFLNIFNFGQFWPAEIDKKAGRSAGRPAGRLKLATLDNIRLYNEIFTADQNYFIMNITHPDKEIKYFWLSRKDSLERLLQRHLSGSCYKIKKRK